MFDRGFHIDSLYLYDHMVECIEDQLDDRDYCLLQKMPLYVSCIRVHILFYYHKDHMDRPI